MTAFESIRSQALELPVKQKFELMFDLQESLPPFPLYEEDDGEAEAMRRLHEGDRDPSIWLDEDQFHAAVKAARKK